MIKGESVFGLVPVIFWVSIERAPGFFPSLFIAKVAHS